jgi:tRNA-dihydrouridine synthase
VYFLDYIEKARKITDTPLMLTGGFRTASVMRDAVAANQLDVVGIARPFTIYPNIANELFDNSRETFPTDIKKTGVKGIDGFMNIIWYEAQIKRLGQGKAPDTELSPWSVFLKYFWLIIMRKLSS